MISFFLSNLFENFVIVVVFWNPKFCCCRFCGWGWVGVKLWWWRCVRFVCVCDHAFFLGDGFFLALNLLHLFTCVSSSPCPWRRRRVSCRVEDFGGEGESKEKGGFKQSNSAMGKGEVFKGHPFIYFCSIPPPLSPWRVLWSFDWRRGFCNLSQNCMNEQLKASEQMLSRGRRSNAFLFCVSVEEIHIKTRAQDFLSGIWKIHKDLRVHKTMIAFVR